MTDEERRALLAGLVVQVQRTAAEIIAEGGDASVVSTW
jgi:hypothetical protein